MSERAPLPPIKFAALAEALLARVEQLVPMWLPGGVKEGKEYKCGSLSGGAGKSCSVNISGKEGLGCWSDFATGEAGNDLISLYAAINGLSNGKAAVQLAREEGLEDVAGVQPARGDAPAVAKPPRPAPAPAPVTQKSDEGWRTVVPVPAMAPAATFKHPVRKFEDIEHTATYKIDDALMGYVVRFKTSDGDKETLPYTWCTSARDGASRWHWKTWDEPRPLYFPGGVSPVVLGAGMLPTVVLVEGEKKAEILHNLLQAHAPHVYAVVSWVGGCNAWKKSEWSWLNGCTVLAWPDCDAKREKLTTAERNECADDAARKVLQATKPLLPAHKQPGMAAMLGIGALLRESHACTVQLLPIPEPLAVADGWDCADAINTDGWDFERVLAFFGQAQPLPGGAAELAPAKKIEGLVDTEGSDKPAKKAGAAELEQDADGNTIIGGKPIPWWLVCYYDRVNKRWLASRKMVILILERDPILEPVLAYNELSNNVQSRVLWPWPHSKVGDVTDAVDLLLGKYLTDTYGLPSIARASLSEAIQTVAHTRRFHPVREQLAGFKWDGKSRIDKWLIHVLGEKPTEWTDKDGKQQPATITKAMAEYFEIVGRCWLLGMVYRVMQPGCKFDYCPVLEGVGGLRKSTAVEILAGSDFYSDTPFEVGRGKEAQEQVQGLWVYEIAELTHFSKAEVGAIKAFISSKVDRYRVAYGTTVGTFPRQCLLVGTTNENTYLRDRTGNRRMWPIPVRNIINTEWLIKYREQLLAEAYELYGQGVVYTPTPEQERRLFVPMQESRLVETAVLSELLHVLTRPPMATGIAAVVNELASFVTIAQLTLALGVDAAKSTPALEAQIRGWLDHEGWERVKKQVNGARAWGYVRPRDWPPIEAEDDMTAAPPSAASGSTEEDADDVPF
ncbi:MAG: VapE family protein [Aquabacterium sp.]|nr:VapE family protein [Aquabacterium sp.]